jgi:hypothetical protein
MFIESKPLKGEDDKYVNGYGPEENNEEDDKR